MKREREEPTLKDTALNNLILWQEQLLRLEEEGVNVGGLVKENWERIQDLIEEEDSLGETAKKAEAINVWEQKKKSKQDFGLTWD